MNTHLTNTAGKIISGLTALALLGTLAGCGKKTDGTQNQAASNASASTTGALENDTAATDSIVTDNEAADMAERHRQEMDHSDMRRGGATMPNGAPATSTPDNSQSAPMKDM
jgi:predicted small lipoprotein YifL